MAARKSQTLSLACVSKNGSGRRELYAGKEPWAYSDSNLRMSACEYEAPMIFLLSYGADVSWLGRQKGEADLVQTVRVVSHGVVSAGEARTRSGLRAEGG